MEIIRETGTGRIGLIEVYLLPFDIAGRMYWPEQSVSCPWALEYRVATKFVGSYYLTPLHIQDVAKK